MKKFNRRLTAFSAGLILSLAVFAWAMSPPAAAQTLFSSIVGTVMDPTSAVIPGATVTATNINTNEERQFVTNARGQYEILNLFPGIYTLEVQVTGFKTHRREGVELASRENARIDIELEVAAQVTEVTVTSDVGARVETESAKLSDVRGLKQLRLLPMNTRSIYRFLVLTPGVTGGMNGTMSVSGSRNNQVHYQVDGVTMSDVRSSNTIGPTLNFIESFEEAQIDFGANSAEYKAIGTLSIASRRGGNEFHGAVYDYYSTGAFRAGDYFNHRRSGTPNHGFGMSIGGPVTIPKVYNGRDKTFWFLSYETTFAPSSVTNFNLNVPLASWKRGDFSGEKTIRDPFAGGEPFPNNMIPENRISQAARQYLPLWPDPNFGDINTYANRNYRNQLPRDFSKPHNLQIRVDHRISSQNTLYGRFLHQRQRNPNFESGLPGTLGMRVQNRRVRHALINDTHIFSPTLINEARFGISWNTNPRHAASVDGPAFIQAAGLMNVTRDGNIPDIHQVPVLRFGRGAAIQQIAVTRQREFNEDLTFQWQNTLSKITGKHSLKFGMEVNKRHQNDQYQPNDLFGNFQFTDKYTGFNFADFLLGTPNSIARDPFAEKREMRQLAWEWFVQDNYKVTNNLTINLGLRYELGQAWSVNGDRLSVFDKQSGSIVVPDTALNLVSELFPTDQVAVIGHSQTAFSERLYNTDKNRFAPRLGFAWRPLGSQSFVLRAGYGVFYNIIPFRPSIFGVPFVVEEPSHTNPANVNDPAFVQWPLAFPMPQFVRGAGVSVPSVYQPDFQAPYAQNWNVTLEKEIPASMKVRASYVGTGGRQMVTPFNLNQPAPGPGLYIDKPRSYPNLAGVTENRNGGSHTYNAMNLELERRFYDGLMFQTSFTYARDLGDGRDHSVITPENTFDRARERADSQQTATRRWIGFFIYELPFGRGKRFGNNLRGPLHAVLGGWEISGSASAIDGWNETPVVLMEDIHGIKHTSSATPASFAYRPNCLGNPNFSPDQRSPDQWFDRTVSTPGNPVSSANFSLPTTPGVFGNCGRSIIQGPGQAVLHGGISKLFSIKERVKLRVYMQASNVLNHPNFDALAGKGGTIRLDRSSAGVITQARGTSRSSAGDSPGPRSMSLRIRIEF